MLYFYTRWQLEKNIVNFYSPLKSSENHRFCGDFMGNRGQLWFSDVFSNYRNRTLAWNRFKVHHATLKIFWCSKVDFWSHLYRPKKLISCKISFVNSFEIFVDWKLVPSQFLNLGKGNFLRLENFWYLILIFFTAMFYSYTLWNLWFSDVFRGYRKRTLAWKGLTNLMPLVSFYTP